MLITKISTLTGKEHTLDLPITQLEIDMHAQGELAQHVWPTLKADQREFLISGITSKEWEEAFPEPMD
jgi:hypothetical protein